MLHDAVASHSKKKSAEDAAFGVKFTGLANQHHENVVVPGVPPAGAVNHSPCR